MIQQYVDNFMERKAEIRSAIAEKHPDNYKELVQTVLRIVVRDSSEWSVPDTENIHEIDDGDYQGTLVYVIPEAGYQPSDYWYLRVCYGSCSGCDTLQAICDYSNEKPTDSELDEYMTLALHIVQGLKQMGGDKV